MEHKVGPLPSTGGTTTFVVGPPGAGKTTLAVERLLDLIARGVPAEQVLVLVPQRTLAWPYYDALHATGARVRVATIGGLARQFVARFWEEVAGPAGFARPDQPPRFLTFETAQYVLNRVVAPLLAAGAFEGATVSRPRLLAQIIDNLNLAAAAGFPPDEIAARLGAAWAGESARARVYDQVQAAALAFRRACLGDNLLDWSFQMDVFGRHVLKLEEARQALGLTRAGGYRHLIVDNTEEDPPVAHDLLREWLLYCDSALVICDRGGGYRLRLGADAAGSLTLGGLCQEQVTLAASLVPSPDVAALGAGLVASLGYPAASQQPKAELAEPLAALHFETRRFFPELFDWAAERISHLVMVEGLPANEMAVLLPSISDAEQFALAERLSQFGIPLHAHRPARRLSADPAIRAILTWARLAHPAWQLLPASDDVAQALTLSIADLDPVRARLLTDIVYRVRDGRPELSPFGQIVPATQERIGRLLGSRYDDLRQWLERYGQVWQASEDRLDQFVRGLVDELLSQPGFGFRPGTAHALAAGNLVESIYGFWETLSPSTSGMPDGPAALGPEYVTLVEGGMVAGQYLASWGPGAQPGVLFASPFTFLLMNRPVRVQLWLDVGSRAWLARDHIYEPLSQPYVLSRGWPVGRVWTDQDEVRVRLEGLAQLVTGLVFRCRERIYLGYSELSEQGYEQHSPLLQAIVTLMNRLRK